MFAIYIPYIYHCSCYCRFFSACPVPLAPAQVPAAPGGLTSTPSRSATGEAAAKKAKASGRAVYPVINGYEQVKTWFFINV